MNVSVGSCCPELAQAHSSVALAWHRARGSTPFGVTFDPRAINQYDEACSKPRFIGKNQIRRASEQLSTSTVVSLVFSIAMQVSRTLLQANI